MNRYLKFVLILVFCSPWMLMLMFSPIIVLVIIQGNAQEGWLHSTEAKTVIAFGALTWKTASLFLSCFYIPRRISFPKKKQTKGANEPIEESVTDEPTSNETYQIERRRKRNSLVAKAFLGIEIIIILSFLASLTVAAELKEENVFLYTPSIISLAAAVVFPVLFGFFVSGECPACKRYHSFLPQKTEKTLIGERHVWENRTEVTTHRNRDGITTGTSERSVPELVTYKKYLITKTTRCEHCDHEEKETSEREE